ncbi:MAG TPA: hypothetical protein DCE71_02390 [Parachlamydiales bacterium]|nr:hypothetical protein [Parachlamydiales bacterium]
MQAHLFLALFSCAEGKQNYKCYIHGHRPLTHLDSLNSIQSRSSPHPNSMLLVDEEERHSALPKKNRFLFCG